MRVYHLEYEHGGGWEVMGTVGYGEHGRNDRIVDFTLLNSLSELRLAVASLSVLLHALLFRSQF
jgi:hypothetical protein